MKVSVFYEHVCQASRQTGKTEKELLEELYHAGVRGLEIRLLDLMEDTGLYARIREAGFQISCIYEFYEMEKEEEKEKSRKHIEAAAETGCGRILVVPGFLEKEEAEKFHNLADQEGEAPLKTWMEENPKIAGMRRGLSRMTGWGKEKGVEVTIEDFDDYTSPLSRNRGIRWFLDNVPDLGFTFDMGNFAFMQEDIWQAWELLADRIRHIHCKDRCRGLEPAPAGKGDIPMRELLEKLKRNRGMKAGLPQSISVRLTRRLFCWNQQDSL